MPTYEYECKSCKHTFEASQKITDKPLSTCPQCGKAARRLISSGVGVIFKGSGFYATDYRKSKAKDSAPTACPKAKEGCDGCKHQ